MKKSLLKHQKVSKYYDHDCLQNFFLLLMPLLLAPIIKNRHILAYMYFIFPGSCPRPNMKVFQDQIDLSEEIRKVVIK